MDSPFVMSQLTRSVIFDSDIDGQIKRAKERINAGIMPNQFKVRLTDYEAKKAAREYV